MNILYISLVDISRPSGPAINELEFIRSMIRSSEVSDDNCYFLIPKPGLSLPYQIENLFFFDIKASSLPLFGLFITQFRYQKVVKNCIKSLGGVQNLDIVVIRMDEYFLLKIPIYLKHIGIPYTIRHFHYDFTKKMGLGSRILLRQTVKALKKSIFIDTTWNSIIKKFQTLGLKSYKLINNGINTEIFYPKDKTDVRKKLELNHFDRLVGYIGGYPLERGVRELIEAAPKLIRKFKNIGFLIIGDAKFGKTSHVPEIKRLIDEKGLSSHFVVTGYLSYEKMPDYYNSLDVGVALVPEDILVKFGNSSQKIYQYLACGVPVVVPRTSHEELADNQFVLEYNYTGTDEFVDCISELLTRDSIGKEVHYDTIQRNFSSIRKYELRKSIWKKLLNENG